MTQDPPGTLAERYERGIRLRKKAPREKHADLRGPANRDPVAILAVSRPHARTATGTDPLHPHAGESVRLPARCRRGHG